jgi:hypothetical protein
MIPTKITNILVYLVFILQNRSWKKFMNVMKCIVKLLRS